MLVFGDFNEILYSHEKLGRNYRDSRDMASFRDIMNTYDLSDMGFMGADFTWDNGWRGDGLVKETLDRFLSNSRWLSLFCKTRVEHLAKISSDHLPILLLVMSVL